MELINAINILELDKCFDKNQVKCQYRKLAKRFHPDITHGNSDIFQQITEAKKYILSNWQHFDDLSITIIHSKKIIKKRFLWFHGLSIEIGRANEIDIFIENPFISRKHLTIEFFSSGKARFIDTSSSGTYSLSGKLKQPYDEFDLNGTICLVLADCIGLKIQKEN